MDSLERAKGLLNICAFELRDISIGDQMTLQYTVASLIDQAVADALKPYAKVIAKEPIQTPLMKIRKRSK